jgi:hypothetical protein
LGIPFSRLAKEGNLVLKLKRITEYVEAALRFACIIGICELARFESNKVQFYGDLTRIIGKPLMGDWNFIRNSLAKKLPPSSIFARINKSFDGKFVNHVVEIRNEFAHMSAPSTKKAAALIGEIFSSLTRQVAALLKYRSLKLIMPLSLQFSEGQFSVECIDIRGDSPSFPLFSFTGASALSTEVVHITEETCDRPVFVSLYPLVVVEPASEPQSWHLLIFDGVVSSSRKGPLSGEEPIKYLDVWAAEKGANRDSKACAKHLPTWMTGL